MKTLGIIPARYASSRFPGKPLAIIGGKSMIHRVYDQACRAGALDRVVVATDDPRIFKHVEGFGGQVVMTAEDHPNGTSRCREVVAQSQENYDVVVNIQGDEPFIDPQQIDQLADRFANTAVDIATLVKKIDATEELFSPNVVKVVFDKEKKALFFSRQPIPFLRGIPQENWMEHHDFFKHIGIYAYRQSVLEKIVRLGPSKLEQAENLEQLRWLGNGYRIHLGITEKEGVSVDTPEDLLKLTNKA
ncbi:MAG: 3-deoxy-manno-octulosonate cytidylyltransferase [Bacteroidales bacterium]|nr:3-deoxy-manno-octulosonate cytidylyltransferase [Bacteroidales bacterium]